MSNITIHRPTPNTYEGVFSYSWRGTSHKYQFRGVLKDGKLHRIFLNVLRKSRAHGRQATWAKVPENQCKDVWNIIERKVLEQHES